MHVPSARTVASNAAETSSKQIAARIETGRKANTCCPSISCMDALGLAEGGEFEDWEAHTGVIPTEYVNSLKKLRSEERKAEEKPAEIVLDSVRDDASVATAGHMSRLALRCELTPHDILARDILRGLIDATPRRDTAKFAELSRNGTVGELTDDVYPALAPKRAQPGPGSSSLSGILGPDVKIVAAEDRPNVVFLLPCHTWAQAMVDAGHPESRLSDAVCVAIEGIDAVDDIRVFGEPVAAIPIIVRCRCNQSPCLCELPGDWAAAGCDLDSDALQHTLRPANGSLMYSTRFGEDAESPTRTRFLRSTRNRWPEPGEVLDEMHRSQQLHKVIGETTDAGDLAATHVLAASRHGVGTMYDSATAALKDETRAIDSVNTFTQTLLSASPTRSLHRSHGASSTLSRRGVSGGYVNESRQALCDHVHLDFKGGTHKVWGPGEADIDGLLEMFPGKSFAGVVELYQGTGYVLNVATAHEINASDTAKDIVASMQRANAPSSPSRAAVDARLARKPLPRVLDDVRPKPHQGSSIQVAARSIVSSAPSTARSTSSRASSLSTTSRDSGWAARTATAGSTARSIKQPSSTSRSRQPGNSLAPTLSTSNVVQSVAIELTAVGCCDVDADVGWSLYTAHDSHGRLLWQFDANARDVTPFVPHKHIPNPELLLPILQSINPLEPYSSQLMQLAHALFPSRVDAMWQYIRPLQDWDAMQMYLKAAEERVRLRITLPSPEFVDGVDMTSDYTY